MITAFLFFMVAAYADDPAPSPTPLATETARSVKSRARMTTTKPSDRFRYDSRARRRMPPAGSAATGGTSASPGGAPTTPFGSPD